MELRHRPRRLRSSATIRSLVSETSVDINDLVFPLFILGGRNKREPINAMPGIERLSIDLAIKECESLLNLGISAINIFPVLDQSERTTQGENAFSQDGLVQNAIMTLKKEFPSLCIISDVALDPYTTHEHDGIVDRGDVLNDETVTVLCKVALSHACAGCDFVSPSDMMDGRIQAIRKTLDQEGYTNVGIIAYSVKYASCLYGPFRNALNGKQLAINKKSYQMNPANRLEAIREFQLDVDEGADIVMIKPATLYLDVISSIKAISTIPVAAYNVSGEYSMIKAAVEKGWIDPDRAINEMLLSIKRAGTDLIFTYFAKEFALKKRHLLS